MNSCNLKPVSLKTRLERRIARKRGDVFLRGDFSDLGSYDQIGRALRGLIRKGVLISIGRGLYARAQLSRLTGQPMPANGLATLKDALRRLGVETLPTQADRDYEAGRSEQVPTGRRIAIRGRRVRRKIGYDGVFLSFERASAEREELRPKSKRRPAPRITVREALRLIWEANRYPILGNEDWRTAARLAAEALERAATAVPAPDDPPEFAAWIAGLCNPALPATGRDEILSALYELFDPEEAVEKED